jgi:putative restriction endonuclease
MGLSFFVRAAQPMTSDAILTHFDRVEHLAAGDQRVPHEPLLVLFALGRWQQGKSKVTYAEAEPDLTVLLREFGRPQKSDHPEQPF